MNTTTPTLREKAIEYWKGINPVQKNNLAMKYLNISYTNATEKEIEQIYLKEHPSLSGSGEGKENELWKINEVLTSIGRCFKVGTEEMIKADKQSDRMQSSPAVCIYDDYGTGETIAQKNANLICEAVNNYPLLKSENERLKKESYTPDEVKSIIQSIYSEFAELDKTRYYPHELKRIIEIEVEQRPVKPLQIFKK